MGTAQRMLLVGMLILTSACSGPGAEHRRDPTDAIFDPSRIHRFALTMAPKDWLIVRDKPEAKKWVTATFTWNGKRLNDIGVRTYGLGSLAAGKPPLKLSFDRNVDGQELSGLDELKLDNSAQDPGYLNEYVATAALRRAGVPASRTGWARLTVNGEFAGFFVVVESIDDRFVEKWFGNDDGALYSINGANWGQGLNEMTEPMRWYESETKVDGTGDELANAAKVVATGTMAEVMKAIDLPGFFRESVARSVFGSQDSFSADGNNFYLFDDRGQIKIIPWDFDTDLGTEDPHSAMKVDPRHPWTTSPWARNAQTNVPYTDPVLKRALADGADVDALVRKLVSGPFSWEWLDAYAAAGAKLIEADARRDVLNRGTATLQRERDLRLWLHARLSALAGREVAHCPAAPKGVLRSTDLRAAGTVGRGKLTIDRTVWGPGFMVSSEHFCSGLFAHAPSRVTIRVPRGYGRLSGAVGLQDWRRRPCGDGVSFTIRQNGEEVWGRRTLKAYNSASRFAGIDLKPGTATLVANPNGTSSCDASAWLELELVPNATPATGFPHTRNEKLLRWLKE